MKRIFALLCVLLMVFSLAACSQGESDAGSEGKTTLKIITWTNTGSIDALKAFNEKFMERYPDVVVELTDVDTNQYATLYRTRLQAGDVDIVSQIGTESPFVLEQVDWAPSEMPEWQSSCEAGVFADLTNEPWVANYTTGATAGTYKDKVYAIATGANVVNGVFYNKQIFADLGLQAPQTWAEFETVCNTLKENGIAPLTVGMADGWPYQMVMADMIVGTVENDYDAFARQLWEGERTFTDEQSLEIYRRIDFVNQNFEEGYQSVDYTSAIGRFVAGKSAMLADGSWSAVSMGDAEFEIGYFPMPATNAEDTRFEGKFDLYLSVVEDSPNKEAAMNWMAMFSEQENYAEFANITGFVPTMDVQVDNAFTNELIAQLDELPLVYEYFYRAPVGVGEYASGYGFNGQYLSTAGGSIATIEELAQLTQTDFENGVKAVKGN